MVMLFTQFVVHCLAVVVFSVYGDGYVVHIVSCSLSGCCQYVTH